MGSGTQDRRWPEKWSERITLTINRILNDGTTLDTFMDLSKTAMCHLKVNNESININVGHLIFW